MNAFSKIIIYERHILSKYRTSKTQKIFFPFLRPPGLRLTSFLSLPSARGRARDATMPLYYKYRVSKTREFFLLFLVIRASRKNFSILFRPLLTINIPMVDKEKRLQMKTIEETFKAEKEILEDFFKKKKILKR